MIRNVTRFERMSNWQLTPAGLHRTDINPSMNAVYLNLDFVPGWSRICRDQHVLNMRSRTDTLISFSHKLLRIGSGNREQAGWWWIMAHGNL